MASQNQIDDAWDQASPICGKDSAVWRSDEEENVILDTAPMGPKVNLDGNLTTGGRGHWEVRTMDAIFVPSIGKKIRKNRTTIPIDEGKRLGRPGQGG